MERLSKYSTEEAIQIMTKKATEGAPLIIFDLETTGLSKVSDRILSFSAIKAKWNGNCFDETDRMDVFIDPCFHIPEEVTEINHITDEMVQDCGDEDDVLPDILKFIGNNAILSGYNCEQFDIPFLDNTTQRVSGDILEYDCSIDVMKMAKEMLNLKTYKLENVAHECGCDVGIEFHNSMDDVIATFRVLNFLLLNNNEKHKKSGFPLEVNGCDFFRKSAKVNRVYIRTYPYTVAYYDIYRGEWICDMKDADMKKLRNDVLKLMKVDDEKGLARLARQNDTREAPCRNIS